MNDTKEQILNTALGLFAENGFEAVSVSDIAGRLDMTKGALYKHFKNKQDIFDSILSRMERLYSPEYFSSASGHDKQESSADVSPVLKAVLSWCVSCFSFWTGDKFASPFRKMLTLEQYRNDEMKRLYCRYLVSSPVERLAELIRSFGAAGAAEKAFSLYSAIYFSFAVYDAAPDKMCTHFILKESIERMCFDIFEKNV